MTLGSQISFFGFDLTYRPPPCCQFFCCVPQVIEAADGMSYAFSFLLLGESSHAANAGCTCLLGDTYTLFFTDGSSTNACNLASSVGVLWPPHERFSSIGVHGNDFEGF
ncbi:hypothetical protein A0H81_12856 [Grifola frondosa]|uniref:Uncharacterized protein n=1 Tax=Grifola frondosa TaxID=5627 RepID=A0A1C7LRB8_GRIFR|nr:hypothetical protein A0H81_12856 [Grifola frondosa]